MDRRDLRWWPGKRPWYVVLRLLATLEDHWDTWIGTLALEGVDPRRWDLVQLLAAWEVQLRRGCKDESEWTRLHGRLYAQDKGRKLRSGRGAMVLGEKPAERSTAGRMNVGEAEAMLARMAAADAAFSR